MSENFSELLQLADNDDVVAQERVGTAYFKGNGVEKDINKAVEYYAKAADNGSGLACYQMGRAFETGTGAPLNLESAIQYYEKSADLGYQNATNKLKTLNEHHQAKSNIEPNSAYNPPQATQNTYKPPHPIGINANYQTGQQKSKTIAALLAFFLGFLGAHNFYLGNTKKGIIQVLLSVTFFGTAISGLWAFVEFIMILTGSIASDAKGIRLK